MSDMHTAYERCKTHSTDVDLVGPNTSLLTNAC